MDTTKEYQKMWDCPEIQDRWVKDTIKWKGERSPPLSPGLGNMTLYAKMERIALSV